METRKFGATKEIKAAAEELKDFYAKEKNARIFVVAEAEGDKKDSAKGCVLIAGSFISVMSIVARGLVDACREIPRERVPQALTALSMTVMERLDASDEERGEQDHSKGGESSGFVN